MWVDVGPIRNKGKSADPVCYKSPEERKGHTEGHGKVQIREKGGGGKGTQVGESTHRHSVVPGGLCRKVEFRSAALYRVGAVIWEC